ncbi:MAG: ribosome small subunit-dependent GTPase A [Clostridiales bacterium]|jgi:ribosome biogenesis GTPase|nr:ribosome small subunit-dependent GTPase A [Clostridiales bacterium]
MLYGRIIKGVGGSYFVKTGADTYTCNAAGVFRNKKITPVIGDMCGLEVSDECAKTGTIVEILQRRNEIIRPRVSNIDQIIIVMAADEPKLDINMLDRYLVILANGNFDVIICINKSDLTEENAIVCVKERYESIGYKVIVMSAGKNEGTNRLSDVLKNKVSAFAGPSGVGKSSIVNLLSGVQIMETGTLSKKISRGKHTTRHVEFLALDENTYVLDTPGFTSLTFDGIEADNLQDCFYEFKQYLGKCAFRNCAHQNEPGCAVKAEVGGKIDENRYNNYLSFFSEIKNGKER